MIMIQVFVFSFLSALEIRGKNGRRLHSNTEKAKERAKNKVGLHEISCNLEEFTISVVEQCLTLLNLVPPSIVVLFCLWIL